MGDIFLQSSSRCQSAKVSGDFVQPEFGCVVDFFFSIPRVELVLCENACSDLVSSRVCTVAMKRLIVWFDLTIHAK